MITRTEYAVLDDQGRLCGLRTYATREQVDDYFAWLTGPRRDAMRREAEENEGSDFQGGNAAWYAWNHGEKDRTYQIVAREVTAWTPVAED